MIELIKNEYNTYLGDLIHYYKLVTEKMPNAYAPYHNVGHVLHVFSETYDGCIKMNISKREMRNLLISALMHDYGHMSKKGDDSLNISTAIAYLREYVLDIDRPHLTYIEDVIRSTKYPYSDELFSESQLIVRDADKSHTFSSEWIQIIIYGLGKELDLSGNKMIEIQEVHRN